MLPETAVAAEWRKVFTNTYVKLKLTLIAVDEAHCIHVWPDPLSPRAWKGAGHETMLT